MSDNRAGSDLLALGSELYEIRDSRSPFESVDDGTYTTSLYTRQLSGCYKSFI